MKKILVTAFEPFGGRSANVSGDVLAELNGEFARLSLPVVYRKASEHVLEFVRDQGPFDTVLLMGEALDRECISLEKIAANDLDARAADTAGVVAAAGAILRGEALGIFTEAPVDELASEVRALGIACEVSLSAGGFVCNDTYFRVALGLNETDAKVLFVHLPSFTRVAKLEQARAIEYLISKV